MNKLSTNCSIVVAYDRRRGIGKNNALPWGNTLPADMRHFRELTEGHTVIMGLNTFRSIGRPLPNRQNIVLSSTELGIVETARSFEQALQQAIDSVYIIGGGAVYRAALTAGIVQRIYATEINANFDADVYFPELIGDWHETIRQHYMANSTNHYPFDFVVYDKI